MGFFQQSREFKWLLLKLSFSDHPYSHLIRGRFTPSQKPSISYTPGGRSPPTPTLSTVSRTILGHRLTTRPAHLNLLGCWLP